MFKGKSVCVQPAMAFPKKSFVSELEAPNTKAYADGCPEQVHTHTWGESGSIVVGFVGRSSYEEFTRLAETSLAQNSFNYLR